MRQPSRPPNVPAFSCECQRYAEGGPTSSSAATPCWPACVDSLDATDFESVDDTIQRPLKLLTRGRTPKVCNDPASDSFRQNGFLYSPVREHVVVNHDGQEIGGATVPRLTIKCFLDFIQHPLSV